MTCQRACARSHGVERSPVRGFWIALLAASLRACSGSTAPPWSSPTPLGVTGLFSRSRLSASDSALHPGALGGKFMQRIYKRIYKHTYK